MSRVWDWEILDVELIELYKNDVSAVDKFVNKYNIPRTTIYYRLMKLGIKRRNAFESHKGAHLMENHHNWKDGEEEPYRAFVNIIDEHAGSVYVDSITAVCTDEYREQLLARAVREINAWLSRYHELQELAELQKAALVMKRAMLKIVQEKVAV